MTLSKKIRIDRLFNLVVFSAIFFIGTAHSADPNIPDPSQKGAYDVGFVQIEGVEVVSGYDSDAEVVTYAPTTVNVWYPVDPGSAPSVGDSYHQNWWGFPFDQPSRLNAVRNAMPAPGLYKMVVNSHGGRGYEAPNAFFGTDNYPNMEILASHGFVGLSYTRRDIKGYEIFFPDVFENSVDIAIQAAIDHQIEGEGGPYQIPIDPYRMGIMGHSNGGSYVAIKTIGSKHGAEPDSRFVAGIYLDALHRATDEQLAATNVPYLNLRGEVGEAQGDPNLDLNGDAFFANTTGVSPRTQLHINTFTHLQLYTGMCDSLVTIRDISLAAEPLAEPFDFAGPPPANDAGAGTWEFWGLEHVAAGREFCPRAGVDPNPAILTDTDNHSVDANGDGTQDSGGPDGINDYYTDLIFRGPGPDGPLSAVPMNGYVDEDGNYVDGFIEILARYQVAFFKVNLELDSRYRPYLTPGFANSDDRVTIEITGGNGGKKK